MLICVWHEVYFNKVSFYRRELAQKKKNFVVHCNSAMNEHEKTSELRKEFLRIAGLSYAKWE